MTKEEMREVVRELHDNWIYLNNKIKDLEDMEFQIRNEARKRINKIHADIKQCKKDKRQYSWAMIGRKLGITDKTARNKYYYHNDYSK